MSINSLARAVAVAALLAIVGGCATRSETVVLLPEKDGRDTAVTVQRENKDKVVLDKPYAAVKQSQFGQETYTSNADEVAKKFGATLAAQPARAASFTLYFIEGKDEFTDESKRIVDGLFAEIARRPVPDVIVIGHTDTVGSDASNDALALKRAEIVRTELIRRGIAAENIQAIGRGKRELAIPTADNVAEPRNRRVVILVR
ncbi:MAG TPA: OmpA family protein [Casimicrobiaceae bacterium]|nr:OmpA family protein [Casimicrobiaceae bacterium]